MTQSAALGTGLSAIAELPIADDVEGDAHRQRAAGRRDHLRVRRPRPDPLSHLARTEDPARGSAGSEAKALEQTLARRGGRTGLFSGAHYSLRAYARRERAASAASTLAALEAALRRRRGCRCSACSAAASC